MSSDFHADKCLVCGKRKQYGRVTEFFKFPYDVERCKLWVKSIGMRELLFMPLEKLREQVVCAAHFDLGTSISNRLHRAALPSKTPYPALSDEDTVDFPKRRNMTETGPIRHNETHRLGTTNDTAISLNSDSVIDYERPLMENLATLVHDKTHVVNKPAGILNSIAVPLMTYSSSLEKGTVFAAADPSKTFDLPFVPFIEPTSQNISKVYKHYTKTRKDTENSNDNISAAPHLEAVKEFIKIEPKHKHTLVGKVKPNIKTVEHLPKNQRSYNVSIGLNTLITGHPQKTPIVKVRELPLQLKKTTIERYKNIKQYTNNRLTINSTKKNVPLIQNEVSAEGTASTLPATDQSGNNETDASHKFEECASLATELYSNEVPDPLERSDSSDETDSLSTIVKAETSCDLTFVPYSQYAANVTPESPNAHTGEGTLDYGLPLMNCIGTVFQGNIKSTIKTEETNELDVIDVPLMKCLKTLENTSDLQTSQD